MNVYPLIFTYNNINFCGSECIVIKSTRAAAEKELEKVIIAVQNGTAAQLYPCKFLDEITTTDISSLQIKKVTSSFYQIEDKYNGDNYTFLVTEEKVTD